ncbi:cupin domain-containing protein [Pedobacter deserti]|uniref:cupin domain-containing protein n=1 Tax=Pedobacter deserti TaxID=2817382 RepID=UPI00210B1994|nr:cupin domain-containing protein [Pedobacter sp. SYSU D00382]
MHLETFILHDDGTIPNSALPVLVYHDAFDETGQAAADWLQHRFAENNWTNSFRWHVYDYHHYHTNTHEVLGVYAGEAELQLGGKQGKKLHVIPGDVIVLPAGTGHISLSRSAEFKVVGAYPNGKEPDLIKITDERPQDVVLRISAVPPPENDPLYGRSPKAGVIRFW